jgi:hypothetical protein
MAERPTAGTAASPAARIWGGDGPQRPTRVASPDAGSCSAPSPRPQVATLGDAWAQFEHFVEHHHINEEVRALRRAPLFVPSSRLYR